MYDLENTRFEPIYMLFRFAPLERLLELQNGHVYMKRLQYFVDKEKSDRAKGKGDCNEARLFQATNIKLIDNETDNVFLEASCGDFADATELKKPVLCFLALNIFENIKSFEYPRFRSELRIDQRMLKDFLADEEPHVLVIYRLDEFLKRVREHLDEHGIGYRHGLVKYRDTRYMYSEKGVTEFNTAFNKDTALHYQREFRLLLNLEVDDHYRFSIGSIADISKILPASSVMGGLVVEGQTGKPVELTDCLG